MSTALKPVIYQLVVRYFGNINTTNQRDATPETNGCGKFADVNEAALRGLKHLGVTHVWLTGVLRQATLTAYPALGLAADDPDVVKGRAGSFYAVRDYFDVCPDYARDPASRMAEFEALVRRLRAAGLVPLIDFVPNHVARGYHSVVRPGLDFGTGDDRAKFFGRDNHFFYLVDPPGQKLRLSRPAHWDPPDVVFDGEFAAEDGGPGRPPRATGNNVTSANPSVYDWYDTVKLNYGYHFVSQTGHYEPRPRLWDLMDQVLAYWQEKGVAGFRCDFAHYVPGEAWAYLLHRARERDPRVYFFAEAYPFAGSGDPITNRLQLIDAGFDAVYHHLSYDRLKGIYQGEGSQDDYDREMSLLPAAARDYSVEYLENHDERRIASPIVPEGGPGTSGFGSAEAGYQLAPLQYLYGVGPVLILNGQEVGEPGAGVEGYGGNDGRTTLYDYWAMPEFVRWVNDHRYDGGGLSEDQHQLRGFYAALLRLCQDPAVRGDGYWGLKYYNRSTRFADCPDDLYSFARFEPGSRRLLVVVANFRPVLPVKGRIRIPAELAAAAGLRGALHVRLVLDRAGAQEQLVGDRTPEQLVADGFPVSLPNQTAHVYVVQEPAQPQTPAEERLGLWENYLLGRRG
jgi:glycosidase